MSIQGRRMREILERVRSFGIVGEADETWPQFLRDWERGCHKSRYVQEDKTDLTHLPLPRIDLLKTDRYMFGSMQILRGCPFTCEFCDPPFGRRPGLKTSAQVPAELEAFARAGLTTISSATKGRSS